MILHNRTQGPWYEPEQPAWEGSNARTHVPHAPHAWYGDPAATPSLARHPERLAFERSAFHKTSAERAAKSDESSPARAARADGRAWMRLLPLREAPSNLLSAAVFEQCLERERNLADRGTRRFSLMVLRHRGALRGKQASWSDLAQELQLGLRSTDLVGAMAADRLAVLLTDTDLDGAHIVAEWIDTIASDLHVDAERTIYVYPTHDAAPTRLADSYKGRVPPSGGAGSRVSSNATSHNGHLKNGHSSIPARDDHDRDGSAASGRGANGSTQHTGAQTNGHATNGRAQDGQTHNGNVQKGHAQNGHARIRTASQPSSNHARKLDPVTRDGARSDQPDESSDGAPVAPPNAACWQVKDLWSELSVPMPWWKRSLDIAASALALLFLSPLFLVVAIAIKLDSPGPVIFRQTRVGRGGRGFPFYKFRTMFVDAEARRAELTALNEKDGPIFKIHDDPRITRVGRLLRRWSIDELPQLWNILRGDISLVGPRSPLANEVAEYERWQRRRLNITGGITCIWQVSGRSQVSFREWMRMDMQYVRSSSLWLDLWLLARTIPAVLSGRGAY
jgi:lipopolysaccharide/colanic/teichoic acid biosynthesis glycosyltransferase